MEVRSTYGTLRPYYNSAWQKILVFIYNQLSLAISRCVGVYRTSLTTTRHLYFLPFAIFSQKVLGKSQSRIVIRLINTYLRRAQGVAGGGGGRRPRRQLLHAAGGTAAEAGDAVGVAAAAAGGGGCGCARRRKRSCATTTTGCPRRRRQSRRGWEAASLDKDK